MESDWLVSLKEDIEIPFKVVGAKLQMSIDWTSLLGPNGMDTCPHYFFGWVRDLLRGS